MGRSLTRATLGLAVLLSFALFVVLRMRPGDAGAHEVPSATQPEAERASAPEPASMERETGRETERAVQRTEVDARDPAAAKAAAEPQRTACLTVELVAAGRPANGGAVELELRGERRHWGEAVDPATGRARFEDLAPGTYLVALPRTPPGFLPPRSFRRRSAADEEARSITLDGEDRLVRFELETAVRVFGYVRAPNGQLA